MTDRETRDGGSSEPGRSGHILGSPCDRGRSENGCREEVLLKIVLRPDTMGLCLDPMKK